MCSYVGAEAVRILPNINPGELFIDPHHRGSTYWRNWGYQILSAVARFDEHPARSFLETMGTKGIKSNWNTAVSGTEKGTRQG